MEITTFPAVRALLQRHADHREDIRPVAAFDCDGTVIRGDIGEAMLYRQIERFFFAVSPAAVWPDVPDREELDALYGGLQAMDPAKRTGSAMGERFAERILSWYFDQIRDGLVIKACTDIVRLFTGFTLHQVRTFAEETFCDEIIAAPGGRTLGTRQLPRGVRYIRETVDLLTALRDHGFEIWAVSGSNRWSVEPVFARLGIRPEHIIGIEMETREGRLTPHEIRPVPIREQKVEAMKRRTIPPPIVSASDSMNDIPLLLAASELRIRVNSRGRDTQEFFRAVGTEPDDSWILIEQPTILQDWIPPWPTQQ